jgi:transposase-like protein
MEHHDEAAALRFLKKAIRRHSVPKEMTIDGNRGLIDMKRIVVNTSTILP